MLFRDMEMGCAAKVSKSSATIRQPGAYPKLPVSPGVLWDGWAPEKGPLLGQARFGEFVLPLPLTGLLVYPMAVVGD